MEENQDLKNNGDGEIYQVVGNFIQPCLIIIENLLIHSFAVQALRDDHDGLHLIDLNELAGLIHLRLGWGAQFRHELGGGELVQDPGLELWQPFEPLPTVHKHLVLQEGREAASVEGDPEDSELRIRILESKTPTKIIPKFFLKKTFFKEV